MVGGVTTISFLKKGVTEAVFQSRTVTPRVWTGELSLIICLVLCGKV